MSDSKKTLRKHYHVLRGQQRVIDEVSATTGQTIHGPTVESLKESLTKLARDAPDLVPPFNQQNAFAHKSARGDDWYNTAVVRNHLATVLGILEVEIEDEQAQPVTEAKTFGAIVDPELRALIERDYTEVQRCYVSSCWKSSIILSGAIVEGVLVYLLGVRETAARAARCAPKHSDVGRWDFKDLIDVAVELKLVSPAIEKLSHPLRDYRNLVHPGNELRRKLTFGQEEARISLEVVNILHRDLHH